MIGLKPGTVKLAHYSTEWREWFVRERRRLRRAFPAGRARIEHIGSTAIPGLDAKPVIDIAIAVPSLRRLRSNVAAMESLNYVYKGEYGLPGRHFFVRGDPVTHHLHLVERRSPHWTRWIVFRDYLLSHPAMVREYRDFKRELARKFKNDRTVYTKSKTPFIERILALAALDAKKHEK